MKAAFPWLLSVVTLVGIYVQGNKHHHGWTIGLANQILWVTFIVLYDAWGLLPLSIALVVLYSRNLLKWRAEGRVPAQQTPHG